MKEEFKKEAGKPPVPAKAETHDSHGSGNYGGGSYGSDSHGSGSYGGGSYGSDSHGSGSYGGGSYGNGRAWMPPMGGPGMLPMGGPGIAPVMGIAYMPVMMPIMPPMGGPGVPPMKGPGMPPMGGPGVPPMKGPGMPNPEMDKKRILSLLSEIEEMPKHRLGWLLGIPRPPFEKLVSELEKENLLSADVKEDGKALLKLTEAGKKNVEEHRKEFEKRMKENK